MENEEKELNAKILEKHPEWTTINLAIELFCVKNQDKMPENIYNEWMKILQAVNRGLITEKEYFQVISLDVAFPLSKYLQKSIF